MIVEAYPQNLRFKCENKDQKFNYTYSGIDTDATDEQIYELATAVNAVQDTRAERITRTKTTLLLGIE